MKFVAWLALVLLCIAFAPVTPLIVAGFIAGFICRDSA